MAVRLLLFVFFEFSVEAPLSSNLTLLALLLLLPYDSDTFDLSVLPLFVMYFYSSLIDYCLLVWLAEIDELLFREADMRESFDRVEIRFFGVEDFTERMESFLENGALSGS